MEKEVSHLNTGKLKLNKLHSKLKLKLQKYSLEPPPPSRPPNKIIHQTPGEDSGSMHVHAFS